MKIEIKISKILNNFNYFKNLAWKKKQALKICKHNINSDLKTALIISYKYSDIKSLCSKILNVFKSIKFFSTKLMN